MLMAAALAQAGSADLARETMAELDGDKDED